MDDENFSDKRSRTPTAIIENTTDPKIGISELNRNPSFTSEIILQEQV